MNHSDPQSSFNHPEQFANFRAVDVNDAFAFTKQTWKDNGPYILKQIIPVIAVLAFLQYVISVLPIAISMLPFSFLSDIASFLTYLVFIPLNLFLTILIQAVIFGMYRPISKVALHGPAGIPAGQSFASMSRQGIFTLLLLSLVTLLAMAFGVCLLVIPAIIIGIIAQPTAYLVSTRGMGMVDAVKASVEIIKSNVVPILIYHGIFMAIGLVLVIPMFILIFGLAFVVAFVAPSASQFFHAGAMAGFYITLVPVYIFVLGTLYTKLIDAPMTTPQPLFNNPEPPTQSAW